MKLTRSKTTTLEANIQSMQNVHKRNQNYSMTLEYKNKQRIPTTLKLTLKRLSSTQNKQIKTNNQSKFKFRIGKTIVNKIKQIKNIHCCQICETSIQKSKQQIWISNCEHKNNFCQSCLHHYAIYKIKIFQEVLCPHDGCGSNLDIHGHFYKNLPQDVQKIYKRFLQYKEIHKNSNIKLCPKQNCEGYLKTKINNNLMQCDKCNYSCCPKCLLTIHQGDCDKQELIFFENNLHYRQCKKCKFIIQKNQGCNHMTCRCSYQFCYVCGADWTPAHYGIHDENGELLFVQVNDNINGVNLNEGRQTCCHETCDCVQCQECCGLQCVDKTRCILKYPYKLFLHIMSLIFIITLIVTRDMLIILGLSLTCVVIGIFGYTFEIINELEGFLLVLAILFLPITMIFGIGYAFKDIFMDGPPLLEISACQMYIDICQDIQNI